MSSKRKASALSNSNNLSDKSINQNNSSSTNTNNNDENDENEVDDNNNSNTDKMDKDPSNETNKNDKDKDKNYLYSKFVPYSNDRSTGPGNDLLYEQELQQIRNESHPLYLSRLELILENEKDRLLAIERNHEERKHHIQMLYQAELKQCRQETADARSTLKDVLIDETISKFSDSAAMARRVNDVFKKNGDSLENMSGSTRSKALQAQSQSNNDKDKDKDLSNDSSTTLAAKLKRLNTRGSKYTLAHDEINTDLLHVKQLLGINTSTSLRSQTQKKPVHNPTLV